MIRYEKMSLAKLGDKNPMFGVDRSNDKNPAWKGDAVRYRGVHAWVRTHFPPSEICQVCKNKKRVVLANVTGIYNRGFDNWLYMCYSCHSKFDKTYKHFPISSGRCVICNKEFIKGSPNSITCSRKCRLRRKADRENSYRMVTPILKSV